MANKSEAHGGLRLSTDCLRRAASSPAAGTSEKHIKATDAETETETEIQGAYRCY